MGDLAQFENLIMKLMANDNAVRGEAEQRLKTALQQAPDTLAMSLLQAIRTSSNINIRELCAILLRKNLTYKDSKTSAILENQDDSDDDDDEDEEDTKVSTKGIFWNRLSEQVQSTVKNELLVALKLEPVPSVRRKIADAIAGLALYLSASTGSWDITKEWNDLIQVLFLLAKSDKAEHRISSLDIFSKLCLYIGDSIKVHFNVLKDILAAGLQDKTLPIRLAALGATVSFIQLLETNEERKYYQNFVPLMFDTLNLSLTEGKEVESLEALETLVELAEVEPTFLRPHLPTVIKAMLSIANSPRLAAAQRQLGLEFLVTLAEKASGMVRKHPDYVKNVVPVVLNFMLDLRDDPDWGDKDDDDDDDDIDVTNSDVGNECLDRLALHLGGRTLIPVLFKLIPDLLRHQDWKHRNTGLMALALVAEGCSKFLAPHLEDIVKLILPHVTDSHKRVRWAACNAVGQLSTDFGPLFQNNFSEKALPAIAKFLEDKDNPRIQSHAASALINFCEHATAEKLKPFLDEILQRLSALLQHGRRGVQEQAVTAIAAIADVVKGAFLKYYDHFVPLLCNILQRASGKEYRMLRGKSLECVTLIALAVGKEKFLPDAKGVLEFLSNLQKQKLEDDDPQLPFLRAAWARVCNTIGDDFVPYLDLVMPPLMKDAELDPDLTIADAEDGSKEGWQYIPIGNKKIGINTALMEEKAAACNMMYQYAFALKGAFAPFVERVAKILIPLVTFYFHDSVRAAATAAMPALLESVKDKLEKTPSMKGDKTPLIKLFGMIFETLCEGASAEMDMEVLLLMLETLCECVEICGSPLSISSSDNNNNNNNNNSPIGCMSGEQLNEACKLVLHLLSERDKRVEERNERVKDEDFDEDEKEKLEEDTEKDEEALSEIAEFIGKIVKYHRDAFLPYFTQQLLKPTLALLQKNMSASDRQAALCIIDDVVEFCGTSALPIYQHFLPLMLDYIGDSSAAVRQAAVYGIGVCAQFGGDKFGQIVPDVMKRLGAVITHSESRTKQNVSATENAISAFGKICQFQSGFIDQQKVLSVWLSFLPVEEDKEEARVTYAQLCLFIEKAPRIMFGEGYQNLPKILAIFAGILGTKLINEETTQKIYRILNQMQSSFPAEVLQKALSGLSAEQVAKLKGNKN